MTLEEYLNQEIDWTDDEGEPTDTVTLTRSELTALIKGAPAN